MNYIKYIMMFTSQATLFAGKAEFGRTLPTQNFKAEDNYINKL